MKTLKKYKKNYGQCLDDAVINRSSPFRIPVFICADQNDIDGRIVVLRKVGQEQKYIAISY